MLLIILAVSLLPLAILATWNGVARIRLDAQEQQQKLAEAAALTASSELNVIHAAEGVLTLLADNPDVRSLDPERCSKPLATIAGLNAPTDGLRAAGTYRQWQPVALHFGLVGGTVRQFRLRHCNAGILIEARQNRALPARARLRARLRRVLLARQTQHQTVAPAGDLQ